MTTADTTIYLDNAATTFPKPESVYVEADRFYRDAGGNAGRGQNPLARRAFSLIEETRALVARWLELPSHAEVTFQPSATHALNTLILGAGLRSEQAVYASPFEHNSVLRPLEYLRKTQGIAVYELPFSPTGALDLARMQAQFAARPPAMVAICQASNVTGQLMPLHQIAVAARAANSDVIIVVDGAQALGIYDLGLPHDVFDALVFSGHKSFYGPYGVAGFVLCRDWRPRPILFGGTGTLSEDLALPDKGPSTFEVGSQNVWALAGLRAAILWLEQVGREAVRAQSARLTCRFADGLRGMPGVDILGTSGERCSIVSFRVAGATPQVLESVFATRAGIAVRSGLHCAPWAHRLLGTVEHGGTVRVSPAFFNTDDDIHQALMVLDNLAAHVF